MLGKINDSLKLLFVFTMISLVSACASERTHEQDPLEPYNRFVFGFNRVVDEVVLKPVATVYDTITPDPVQKSVLNFFDNLDTIPTVVNDLLQLKLAQAGADTLRFGINSTVGIGGLFDPATRMGLEKNENDFGLTMANYGYKESSYFVLPLLGSRTIRDTIAVPVDYYTSVYPYIGDDGVRYGLLGGRVVSRRADLLPLEDVIKESTLDRYTFERDAYLQKRADEINKVRGEVAEDPFVEEF